MKDQIRHYAEEILRILDEEEAEIIEDEVPVESTPEPVEPEPIEEVPSDHISNLKAEIILKDIVRVSWTGGKGKFDIEFYRPSVDKKWRHSVHKYLKVFVDAESGSYNIGLGDPVFGALFRVKQGDWVSKPVVAVYPKPEPIVVPEPVKEEPITEPVKEEKPEPIIDEVIEQPKQKTISLLIYFVNYNWMLGNYIDIKVNDVWYNLSELNHDSPEWTVRQWGARGLILDIPDAVKSIEFRESQIKVKGFDNDEVGIFGYKIGAKAEKYKLSKPTPNGTEDPDSWATWFRLYGARYPQKKDDFQEYAYMITPNLFVGGNETTTMFGTHVNPDWNRTGKMAVILFNARWNELPK